MFFWHCGAEEQYYETKRIWWTSFLCNYFLEDCDFFLLQYFFSKLIISVGMRSIQNFKTGYGVSHVQPHLLALFYFRQFNHLFTVLFFRRFVENVFFQNIWSGWCNFNKLYVITTKREEAKSQIFEFWNKYFLCISFRLLRLMHAFT